jgi:alginate O-acetyltransferase complex protein AlgI
VARHHTALHPWGLLQGTAIALEHGWFGRWLHSLWRPLQHIYALLVIMLGWVFFRSPNLNFALRFLRTLVTFTHSAKPLPYSTFPTVPTLTWLAMAAGILLSLPLKRILPEKITRNETAWVWVQNILTLGLFTVAVIVQAGTNYQPFIYGDF